MVGEKAGRAKQYKRRDNCPPNIIHRFQKSDVISERIIGGFNLSSSGIESCSVTIVLSLNKICDCINTSFQIQKIYEICILNIH